MTSTRPATRTTSTTRGRPSPSSAGIAERLAQLDPGARRQPTSDNAEALGQRLQAARAGWEKTPGALSAASRCVGYHKTWTYLCDWLGVRAGRVPRAQARHPTQPPPRRPAAGPGPPAQGPPDPAGGALPRRHLQARRGPHSRAPGPRARRHQLPGGETYLGRTSAASWRRSAKALGGAVVNRAAWPCCWPLLCCSRAARCSGPHEPLDEACEHLTAIPTPVNATASAASAPELATHTHYEVALPDVSGGRDGRRQVRLDPAGAAAGLPDRRPAAGGRHARWRPSWPPASSGKTRALPRAGRLVRIRRRRRPADPHPGRLGQHRATGGPGPRDGSRCALTRRRAAPLRAAGHRPPGPARCCRPSISTIRRGTTVAVLGRNGSGKSTLFKTLLGFLPAVAGAVRRPDPPPAAGLHAPGLHRRPAGPGAGARRGLLGDAHRLELPPRAPAPARSASARRLPWRPPRRPSWATPSSATSPRVRSSGCCWPACWRRAPTSPSWTSPPPPWTRWPSSGP